LDADDDVQKARPAFVREAFLGNPKKVLLEQYDVVFYGDKQDKVAAFLIIPRDSGSDAHRGFYARLPDASDPLRPWSELQSTVMALNAQYPDKVE